MKFSWNRLMRIKTHFINIILWYRKQAQKSSVDDEGNDADADFHDDDDDDQFLSLDDMQESKNLNLKEDFDAGEVRFRNKLNCYATEIWLKKIWSLNKTIHFEPEEKSKWIPINYRQLLKVTFQLIGSQ